MIGAKIRQLRTQKGLTLQELARKTSTTAGYLSQLERDLTDPSLATLRRVASALGVPVFSLLREDGAAAFVPASLRHKISFSDAGVIYELLTPPNGAAGEGPDFLMMTFSVPPRCFASEERISHDAAECLYLTSGALEVLIGENASQLTTGDCIVIPSCAPHNLYNPGPELAEGISCLKPGIFISTIRP